MAEGRKINYVQLEVVQFLADLIAMSPRERSAYVTIIFYLYNNKGSCENDLQKLAKLCSERRAFDKIWHKIKPKFTIRNGIIKQKRVTKELAEAQRRLQAARDKGLKGAKARWSSNAQAMPKQCLSIANGNGNNKEKENTKRKRKPISSSERQLQTWKEGERQFQKLIIPTPRDRYLQKLQEQRRANANKSKTNTV